MDISKVLFSPNGRIAQQDYWVGVLIIIAANVVSGFIPLLGTLIWLGLIYVGVCVYGKRLHDIGKSAWVHGIVWLVQCALGVVGFILAASGSLFLIAGVGTLVWIVYTIWLGVSPGDAGANRFGPPPGTVESAPEAPAAQPAPPPSNDGSPPTVGS